MSLDKKEIARRFFTLFTVKNQTALAEYLGVTPSVVTEWKKGRSAVPWEKLTQAVEETGVSWDWLLAGKGEEGDGLSLGEEKKDAPPAKAREASGRPSDTEQMVLLGRLTEISHDLLSLGLSYARGEVSTEHLKSVIETSKVLLKLTEQPRDTIPQEGMRDTAG